MFFSKYEMIDSRMLAGNTLICGSIGTGCDLCKRHFIISEISSFHKGTSENLINPNSPLTMFIL